MTTLTKAKFFEVAETKTQLLEDVPGFGDVWIKDVGELQRSRRVAALFDNTGNRVARTAELRRLHEIIDQVCIDESGTPMFTDADIDSLSEVASHRIEPLYAALAEFNGTIEKKEKAELEDTEST